MNDWFIWNGARCTEYGMHVMELPPPTIPAERVTFTNVPGRPGSLTTLEGEDVYEDLVLTVQCVLSDPEKIPPSPPGSGAAEQSPLPTGQAGFTTRASSTRSRLKRSFAAIPTGALP